MKATNDLARHNVGEVVEWLKEQFGYEDDDLPTGVQGKAGCCPVANAIKTTPGVDKAQVGLWAIEINDKVMFYSGNLVKDIVGLPDVPRCVEDFVTAFDDNIPGWLKYRK